VGDVVDSSADTPEAIGIAHDHMRGHLGVFAFRASVGTVLAIACDIEHGAEVVLQLDSLVHQFFRTRVVVDYGQDREELLPGKENVTRVSHEIHPLICQRAPF
jgi:hypothetical protein